MPTRTVTLALVDSGGTPLGTLPLPGVLPSPYWAETGEVVDLARQACGIDVTVLRLLSVRPPVWPGNHVTYVAEFDGPAPDGLDRGTATAEWTAPQPKRMPWAVPGGPAATLAWATRELAALGVTVTGSAHIRTWNLSSIWRLDTDAGPVWCKQVPPFAAHEGALLRWLRRPTTPVVLAHEDDRTLLADIPGTDLYAASVADRVPLVTALADIQTDTVDRIDELLALGVPDARARPFHEQAVALAGELRMSGLDDLVDALPALFAEVAECGVPDTLVHGDFHPGNTRTGPVVIDWGDSVVGHPALDLLRMYVGLDATTVLVDVWSDHWRRAVPGSQPKRAVELLRPVGALREALIYRGFLNSIERDERVYHEQDVIAAAQAAIERHRMHKDHLRS